MPPLDLLTLEAAIPLFFLTLIITWFCAIIYFIPIQLYLDQKAVIAEQRLRHPKLDSKQD
jgi:hypothetical protein